jgi:hypothetical protein
MTIKKKLWMVFLTGIIIVPSLAQGNRPSKELSKKEREEAYQKGLELDQIPRGAIELELEYVIPSDKEMEEKEIFFRNVLNFTMDERRHIYIPDGALCVVYELDTEGKLVHKYDKKGQGPGELQFPLLVLPFNQQVIVYDGRVGRMAFFDRDWKYIKSFSYFKSYFPIALGSNGLFYCSDPLSDRLLSILDTEGKMIGSFGELPYKTRSPLNRFILAVSPAGSIWIGMSALAKLKKFSSGGRLEKEIDIIELSSQWTKNNLRENLQYARDGVQGHTVLLQALAFIGEDVLVMNGGIVQPIFRFDPYGQMKNRYYIRPKIGVYKNYFYVLEEKNGEERFYILQSDRDTGDRRIGVYGRKK